MTVDKFGRTLFDRCYDFPIQDFSSTSLQTPQPKYYLLPIYIRGETIMNKSKINLFDVTLNDVFTIPIREATIENVIISRQPVIANQTIEILLNDKKTTTDDLKGKNITQEDKFTFIDPKKVVGSKHLIIFILKCSLVY